MPEDTFLAVLRDMALRDGRALPRKLADEIERLPAARLPARPKRQPLVAQLEGLLSRAPEDVSALAGAVAAMRSRLHWEKSPANPKAGEFQHRHCFCTLTGPKRVIPSDRLQVGLFMIDGATFYPHHMHSADEVYLPLSGDAVCAVDSKGPRATKSGRFIQIPSWSSHAVWTGARPILMAWAWLGDFSGGYRYGFPGAEEA